MVNLRCCRGPALGPAMVVGQAATRVALAKWLTDCPLLPMPSLCCAYESRRQPVSISYACFSYSDQ
jgi:hypothetical protein